MIVCVDFVLLHVTSSLLFFAEGLPCITQLSCMYKGLVSCSCPKAIDLHAKLMPVLTSSLILQLAHTYHKTSILHCTSKAHASNAT